MANGKMATLLLGLKHINNLKYTSVINMLIE